jgi:hypothetical protein
MSTEKKPTPMSRMAAALKEGAKRAPVEFALEKGQALLVNHIMRGFRGTRAERASARKFLLWFFSSPAGQAALAGAISAGAPLAARAIGKEGPIVQTVADEFAARAATIATREGMKFAANQLQPLFAIFASLFDAMEKADRPGGALGMGTSSAAQDFGLGVEAKTARA